MSRADLERRLRAIERKLDPDPDVSFGKTLEDRVANLERALDLRKSTPSRSYTPAQREVLRRAGYFEASDQDRRLAKAAPRLRPVGSEGHSAAHELERALAKSGVELRAPVSLAKDAGDPADSLEAAIARADLQLAKLREEKELRKRLNALPGPRKGVLNTQVWDAMSPAEREAFRNIRH
jgi:hypothetical protein